MEQPTIDTQAETAGASVAPDHNVLLAYLRDHDAPCPVCGYNLRHLTHDVCPECGHQFKLAIGSVHAAFGYLLAFLAPMMMVAGLALVIAALFLVLGAPAPREWGVYVTGALGLADGVIVLLIYRKRAVFLRCTLSGQRLLAILSWGFHSIAVTLLLKFGIR